MPPNKPDSSPQSKTNRLIVQMVLGVVLPPVLTGLYVFLSGHELPAWLRDAIFILVVSIEFMIFTFTAKMVLLLTVAQSTYDDILKLGNQVREPLENMGKMLLNFKDLLPLIEKAMSKIDKEQLKKALEDLIAQIEIKNRKLTPEELKAVAERLTGGK